MNRTRVETVMTYEDWCSVKKMFRDTASTCIQWIAVLLITVGLPIGMIAHWLLIGY